MRRRCEEDRLRWVGVEGPLPHPEMRDELGGEETEPRRGEAGEAGDLPAVRGTRPVEEPKREGRDDEERDGPVGDEVLDLVADERVAAKRSV